MAWVGWVGGVWGLATIIAFIQAIRLCYAVEKRSWPEKFERLRWRHADIPRVAFNAAGVARDEETQMLRRRMNTLLLAIIAGFVAFAIVLNLAGAGVEGAAP